MDELWDDLPPHIKAALLKEAADVLAGIPPEIVPNHIPDWIARELDDPPRPSTAAPPRPAFRMIPGGRQ